MGARQLRFEFRFSHLEHFGGAIKNLPAQISTRFRPAGERSPGRHYRVAKIFARSARKIRDQTLATARWQDSAALAPDKLSADEKLVGFRDLDSRRAFRHRVGGW